MAPADWEFPSLFGFPFGLGEEAIIFIDLIKIILRQMDIRLAPGCSNYYKDG